MYVNLALIIKTVNYFCPELRGGLLRRAPCSTGGVNRGPFLAPQRRKWNQLTLTKSLGWPLLKVR